MQPTYVQTHPMEEGPVVRPDIRADLERHRATTIQGPNFCVVYGSSGAGTDQAGSDVDVMFFVRYPQPSLDPHIRFMQSLHEKYGMTRDDEVPPENKLIIPYELAQTVARNLLFADANHEVCIPPVVKDKDFLCSDHIRQRLVFNVLTTPTTLVGGDALVYETMRYKAAATLAALGITMLGKQEFTPEQVMRVLQEGPNGTSGEMHLGYKESKPAVSHLWSVIAKGLHQLQLCRKVETSDGIHYRRTPEFPYRMASTQPAGRGQLMEIHAT